MVGPCEQLVECEFLPCFHPEDSAKLARTMRQLIQQQQQQGQQVMMAAPSPQPGMSLLDSLSTLNTQPPVQPQQPLRRPPQQPERPWPPSPTTDFTRPSNSAACCSRSAARTQPPTCPDPAPRLCRATVPLRHSCRWRYASRLDEYRDCLRKGVRTSDKLKAIQDDSKEHDKRTEMGDFDLERLRSYPVPPPPPRTPVPVNVPAPPPPPRSPAPRPGR